MASPTKLQLFRLLSSVPTGAYSLGIVASQARLDPDVLEHFFMAAKIGSFRDGVFYFTNADRVKIALEAIKLGAALDEVSKYLGWEDFEGFAKEILERFGYRTIKNLRLKRPRLEVDLVGIKERSMLVVDCKRWQRGLGTSYAKKAAQLQTKRAEALMNSHIAKDMGVDYAIPMLLTLYAEDVPIVEGVPLVPIAKLSGFLNELDGYLWSITLVKSKATTR